MEVGRRGPREVHALAPTYLYFNAVPLARLSQPMLSRYTFIFFSGYVTGADGTVA